MKRGGQRQKPKDYEALVKLQDAKIVKKHEFSKRLAKIYARSLVILSREIAELRKASVEGKLDPFKSADLRSYVKLLGEVNKTHRQLKQSEKEAQAEDLSQLSEDEFKKKVTEYLKEKK